MTTYTYDLTQDWSNITNPNGPWALLQGSTPLPFDANWTPLGGTTSLTPQPAWAPGNNPGNFLPAMFQATAPVSFQFAVPLVVGDVYVHATDSANGQNSGIVNIEFTAPMAGVADISALLQNVGLTYRQQDWQLSVGGTVDLSGAVPLSATTYNLSDIVLSAGETVDLALFPDSNGLGTFVLTDLSINFVPPPTAEPDRAHVLQNHTGTADAAHGVLANDADPIPGDTLSVSAVNGNAANVGHAFAGSYGTLTLNADGSYSYSANHGGLPLPAGVGIDTFSYTAIDGDGSTVTSTLTVVVTSPGQHYVGGTAGATIHGGFGSYVLDGGAGNDSLIAGIGLQVLIGGPNDTLNAGLGFDTFVFAPNFGENTITHFNPLFDSIELPKSEFANFAAVKADAQQVGHDTIITYDTQDAVTLKGVSLSSLHASDFHFV